ncbi:exodeoxyribonuclease VII small subunit [Tunicatimonas pelagia]|uniref:exodeoxyribonuclease VII small subunit n=1 Tax=Tunicatimonas pelagia TaxID=931531 RepID=UPI002666BD96|nr:exodeoxyribonuclease VII small subunit [Tunicatimonas pelagia]WKN42710.1 exodeoxyribonuclease VII small subunit [Tunicatimonas pelagia]
MPKKKSAAPESYQAAMQELQEIVDAVENQELDVDTLSEKVKHALALVQFCKSRLRATEEDLNQAFKED